MLLWIVSARFGVWLGPSLLICTPVAGFVLAEAYGIQKIF
tara:strand:+ start:50 stop:169 length:120 start_codon:yes stop_codon:yes gene_type:complete